MTINQNPSLFKQCDQMLKRVFMPFQAIRQAEVYIDSYRGDTGLIGTDQHYNFHKHIKTSAGEPLSLSHEDFYVNLKIVPIEYKANIVLKIIEFVLKKFFSLCLALKTLP